MRASSTAAARWSPRSPFTAAVMVALPKAGSGLAAGVALKTAGAIAKPALAILPGLFGGLFGIWFGLRKELARAKEPRERRGLWTASAFMAAAGTAFSLLIPHVRGSPHPKVAMVALWLGLLASIDFGCLVWVPRVMRRRLAAELAADPVGAAARLRRKRRAALLGMTLGTALSAVPVVWFLLQ